MGYFSQTVMVDPAVLPPRRQPPLDLDDPGPAQGAERPVFGQP
jgi:hypothetical protein